MNDLDTFTKLPKNVGDLGKLIVATGFEWLPKVQKIAQSGHTGPYTSDPVYHLLPLKCTVPSQNPKFH